MPTDIHINIDNGLTQEDYQCFFAAHMGSVYFRKDGTSCPETGNCTHWSRLEAVPSVLAGDSAWPLPTRLPQSQEETDRLPDPVGEILDAFPPDGPQPVTITPERREKVRKAMDVPAELAARYGEYAPRKRRQDVITILEQNEGRGAFLTFE